MARKLRVEYPGAVDPLMNRGGHREEIFRDEPGRERLGAALAERAKGDPEKWAVAVRLRAETAMTVQWIAGRLQRGAPGYLNHLLYRERHEKGE